jgi:xanthine dehydrogenase accessory factor
MNTQDVLRALLDARERRERCALVTVVAARGSTPREAGAKMLVYASGQTHGTIGGGRFEALVIEEGMALLVANARMPVLKTYPLREGLSDSFGAVCGGEVTVLIEPQPPPEALFLVGAGHCARAIARLAANCGWHVTVIDDRSELLADFPAAAKVAQESPAEFIASREWRRDEALVIVSRNYGIDRDALLAALRQGGMGYAGMMGSGRKVRLAFDDARAAGIAEERLARVYAPLGLDIKAETPDEIAVSVMAQVFQVMRGATGGHLGGGGPGACSGGL